MTTVIIVFMITLMRFDLVPQPLSWGKEMVAMSGFGPGYSQTVIITPYMHCMIYHAPTMMRKHGSLRHFSRQGITPYHFLMHFSWFIVIFLLSFGFVNGFKKRNVEMEPRN